ncbi:UNVERIFIED_CONTAM: putative late blight resistance proteinR1B-12 [Sesamum latifolium]|uniref:Late blight resistance proteinR1B-12 n=1 Tax=Sesamum latifolium TaxID=2727402 RepID=A0AAW2U5X4_9LAMI
MAYAALISLKLTIECLLNSSSSDDINVAPETTINITSAYEVVKFLQQQLLISWEDGNNNESMKAVEGEIREATCRLEDVLESSSAQPDETLGEVVKQEINLFCETVKKINEQLSNTSLPEEQEDDDATALSRTNRVSHEKKCDNKMVGLDDDKRQVTTPLTRHSKQLELVSIIGMAGIGKTALAQAVYADPKLNDEDLFQFLYRFLKGRRYLIVLDDIWSMRVWDDLRMYLPDDRCGSRIVLTTRLEKVSHYASRNTRNFPVQKRFLNEEESWYLLHEKVFGEGHSCPPELEKPGKEIARKCEGLPLVIIAVGKHLYKAEMTVECWNKVAHKEYSLIIDADEDLSKVLYSSYEYLPQNLKAYFLYTRAFPHDNEIPASKLIHLWSVEQFLEPHPSKTIENVALHCLEELVSNNIVLVHERSPTGGIKTCSVHSVFWHLCIREAKKNKFFHVINSYANGVNGGVKGQRRLCIHNNVFFGIKNVYESMESTSNIRSLLCTGPHHQYPVPTCLSFSLLRILEALTIRFYKFPNEVLKLVKLKARRPYLPMELWDMQELRHLEVMGSDLPDPNSEGALLPNLLTLSGISAHSCTKEVLGRIPDLKKLGIQTELALDVAETLCCLDHLSHLHRLESLKCVIVNPTTSSQVVPVATPARSVSWPSLKKLTLSGLGFPWEYMSDIAQLRNLEVLKLHCYAFQGPEWVTSVGDFSRLKYLLLEDIDLESWDSSYDCFLLLQRLTIQHCYKLKEIPFEIGEIPTLQMIELVDCNDSLVASARQLLSEQEEHGNVFQVYIKSSQDDRKLKS